MTTSVAERNKALLGWYEANKRSLPWRDVSDPYLTLVSELMLQQTQVDRVIPKFATFIETWPTVEALAVADQEDVLRAWSGLGYNSRAKRLHETARIVATGGWPDSVEGLTELPGIGPYTAAAIGSIAFGWQLPAIDTNIKRVLSRWTGIALDGSDLRDAAADALGAPAGDWNQAVMDLGSALCRTTEPQCGSCPVSAWCVDPTIYEPPPRQPRFAGSRRELRGAMLKAHLNGESPRQAGITLGRTPEEITSTLEQLGAEGLIPVEEAST